MSTEAERQLGLKPMNNEMIEKAIAEAVAHEPRRGKRGLSTVLLECLPEDKRKKVMAYIKEKNTPLYDLITKDEVYKEWLKTFNARTIITVKSDVLL